MIDETAPNVDREQSHLTWAEVGERWHPDKSFRGLWVTPTGMTGINYFTQTQLRSTLLIVDEDDAPARHLVAMTHADFLSQEFFVMLTNAHHTYETASFNLPATALTDFRTAIYGDAIVFGGEHATILNRGRARAIMGVRDLEEDGEVATEAYASKWRPSDSAAVEEASARLTMTHAELSVMLDGLKSLSLDQRILEGWQ